MEATETCQAPEQWATYCDMTPLFELKAAWCRIVTWLPTKLSPDAADLYSLSLRCRAPGDLVIF